MNHAEHTSTQNPAPAAFLGAHRAERYFEEAPTETVRHAAGSERTVLVERVPHHLTAVPQLEDNPSGRTSEEVLRRVADPGDPAAATTPADEAEPVAPRASGWGRRRRLAEELERDRHTVRSSTWTRSVGILVANPKGSVGKTPTSLLLGAMFASIRGGQTAVLEVTDDPGSLALRAEGPIRAGLGELVRDASVIQGAGQLAAYCAQQTSFAAVIGSPHDRAPLDAADVQNVTALLQYFYPVRVMDSGNQISSSAFFGAVYAADVLVIPVLNALDAVAGAEQLLRHLRRVGGDAATLADNAVVVRLDDGRRVAPDTRQYVTAALAAANVAAVIDVPFDPHIADRSTLTLDRLRPATTAAFTRAAASVCDRLTARLT